MIFTMTSSGNVRRIPCWETSPWMQNKFTSLPSVSVRAEQWTKVTWRCGASQQTCVMLFYLHHNSSWKQICFHLNPWLMRESVPYFASWSVILLIWFRSFLYFCEYIWGGQLGVEKSRQMFSLPLQTRCCLTGREKYINCLANPCQQPNVHPWKANRYVMSELIFLFPTLSFVHLSQGFSICFSTRKLSLVSLSCFPKCPIRNKW